MDERYLENRRSMEQFFIPGNIEPGSGKIDVSPSEHFQLEINRYFTRPEGWKYSRGVVSNIVTTKVVADVKRNYGHFWHTWVQHPNGYEYLLCGEDYQGYSVLNLNTGNYISYFPEEGYQGIGFCWVAVHPSPDGLVLAVDGCYWACPYELVVFDFRNPETLPYPELARFEELNVCNGWTDNDTFTFKREITIRKSDGVDYDSLSEQEQEILDNDPTLVGNRIELIQYKRPAF